MNEYKHLGAWQVVEHAFPRSGTPSEQLRFLAQYAILAPSNHNSQPWQFRVAGNVLELFADRRRSMGVIDPKDRELVIGCGAALFNLRTAMYYFGCVGDARPFPEPRQPDLLARVTLDKARMQLSEWADLFKAIPLRVTNRGPFERSAVPPAVVDALMDAAHIEGSWLAPFKSAHTREAVALLIAEGDRTQFDNPEFRRELAEWLHSARDKDGLPGYAKGVSELLDFTTPAIAYLVRTFDLGNGLAAHDRKLATGSPLLACLGTAGDDPLAWLIAGQALQRVLLVATANGFHVSFLNQPIEVPELRPKLSVLSGRKGHPQILLRVGRGKPVPHTPRRPLEEVFVNNHRPG